MFGLPLSARIRKILVSVKFASAILGPEMAAPILRTPGKMRSFCRKTCVHKIPRFRGGYFGFFLGGEVPILFLWRIFLNENRALPFSSHFAPQAWALIARVPKRDINFARLNRRENCHSPALFDRKEIAHLGALTIEGFCWEQYLREAKPGGFQTGGSPTFFGRGPDRVADPFGNIPYRCFL